MTDDRYQLKSFQDDWLVLDVKAGMICGFQSHKAAYKSVGLLNDPLESGRLDSLTWHSIKILFKKNR